MLRVIKVGGSLLDWPDLPAALKRWLDRQSSAVNVLVGGGGALADCVRAADQRFRLGDERAHWLAVDCMSITARILAHAYPGTTLIVHYPDLFDIQTQAVPRTVVCDVREFLGQYEPELPGTPLPHDWTATSDSIAARLAQALHADELVLLKSSPTTAPTLAALASSNYVDRHFPSAATGLGALRIVDLRAES